METPPVRDDSRYRRPAEPEQKKPEVQPARPAVPVVQQTIGEAAYQAPIKVPVKKKAEEEEEGIWMPTPYNYPPITDLAKPQQGVTEQTEPGLPHPAAREDAECSAALGAGRLIATETVIAESPDPAGIYLYTLVVGDQEIDTKKMIITK